MVFCVLIIGVQVDVWMNPWIKTASDLHWWNIFTSEHGFTILFVTYPITYVMFAGASSLLFAIIIATRIRVI